MIEIHLAGDKQRSFLVERVAYSKTGRPNNMTIFREHMEFARFRMKYEKETGNK